jgi:two-component system alkaline phosphatase synthesis response regulator PhoP
MKPFRILIIEDDKAMASALTLGFEHEGYIVRTVTDGVNGLHTALSGEADMLILDVMLPKMSGLDLCKQLRASGNKTPVIMLTARGQELDKVVGLKVGADDYVTKPFSFLELLARVEAVLRRSVKAEPLDEYRFGNITLDFKTFRAVKGRRSLDLSVREFAILKVFIENRDSIVTREKLLKEVWEYSHSSLTRTVDTHIGKLRQKIEDDPGNPRYLITVPRSGYRFTG